MKLAVEFPSVMYRAGGEAVAKMATAIEEIGFDQLDIFDHVVMGHPLEDRNESPYPAKMPILEALTTLSFFAAVTSRIGLGTEVLVLPQRQPALVAKQIATIDTLSGGRVRLGVGVGWQGSEYDALGVPFAERGRRMDEAIAFLRHAWSDDPIEFQGLGINAHAVAMEPKPPQGNAIPIWIGGESEVALRRAGSVGDGWLAVRAGHDPDQARRCIQTIKNHAETAGRDPEGLGFQCQVAPPAQAGSSTLRDLYSDPPQVAAAAAKLQEAGFGWVAINGTGLFQAGARGVDAQLEALDELHDCLRREVGPP